MKSRIVFICPILQFPAWREIRPRMPLQEAPQVSSDVLVTIWSKYETDASCGTNINNSRFHFSFSLFIFAGSGLPFVWFRQHRQDSCLGEAWTAAGGPGVCDKSPTANLSERDSLNLKVKADLERP